MEEIFKEVSDFRMSKKVKHYLNEILVIALCAVLSGAEDCGEIETYGKEKYFFLKQFLELPNGIPSHDTFNRIFRYLEPKSFGDCLCRWSEEIIKDLSGRYQINIDGKVLKATGEKGKKNKAICLVSAWVSEYHLSLGQVKVDKKSNEKTAIIPLLDDLELTNALVSIDAMGCDKKIASKIVSKQGNYLLALKKNQKSLYEEVNDWMKGCKDSFDRHEMVCYTGGRIEKRVAYVCNDLRFIDELENWKGCKRIIMIESERSFKNKSKETSKSIRFYISSLEENAEYFNTHVKNHWSIENNLHWQLDVVFSEDQQRIRKDNGAENFSTLRKMALQLIIQHKGKQSLKKARKRVAWNERFLIQILQSISCV